MELGETFKAEVDILRSSDRTLAEITFFKMEKNSSNNRLRAAILHVVYIYARRIYNCSDFVIEVKPRHLSFYKNRLGFKQRSTEKIRKWAEGPAMLLSLDMEYLDEQIKRFGGLGESAIGKKNLYRYFFSKEEEDGIFQRLTS